MSQLILQFRLNNENILEKDFFPVSDDQCGGVYCFKKNNGKFEDRIYYLDLSNLEIIVEETEFDFIQIFMKLAFNKQSYMLELKNEKVSNRKI